MIPFTRYFFSNDSKAREKIHWYENANTTYIYTHTLYTYMYIHIHYIYISDIKVSFKLTILQFKK